jgi:ubiquinone/menaquinone biosynthesis C-methylase UbiE
MDLVFERKYKKSGLKSERRYPNEPLVQFLAGHYFNLSGTQRRKTKILEIGSGSGTNLWMIAREGFDAYGIDIAPSSIALCKQMLESYGEEADLRIGSMKALPYDDNFFDAMVDVFTIEHTDLQGHKETYAEVFRCLKKGGRFFSWHLGAGSINFLKGGGKRLDRWTIDNAPNKNVPYFNNGLTCFLTPTVARTMLREQGFTDIKIERVTRTYKEMTQKVEYLAISALRS